MFFFDDTTTTEIYTFPSTTLFRSGAANVALNVRKLGAEVRLISAVGADNEGRQFLELLGQVQIPAGYIYTSAKRPTTVKTRIIANNQQQAIRLDSESTAFFDGEGESKILQLFEEALDSTDAIIFQDYDKGVLSPRVIHTVMEAAIQRNIPTLVDPKKRSFFGYNNATVFKPNLNELAAGLGMEISKPVSAAQLGEAAGQLFKKMHIGNLFITLSEEGVYVNDGKHGWLTPSHKRNVYDVSGAGDTVAAVASLCLASGLPARQMAEIANLSGGLVCEHVGVVPIEPAWIRNEYKRLQEKQ